MRRYRLHILKIFIYSACNFGLLIRLVYARHLPPGEGSKIIVPTVGCQLFRAARRRPYLWRLNNPVVVLTIQVKCDKIIMYNFVMGRFSVCHLHLNR